MCYTPHYSFAASSVFTKTDATSWLNYKYIRIIPLGMRKANSTRKNWAFVYRCKIHSLSVENSARRRSASRNTEIKLFPHHFTAIILSASFIAGVINNGERSSLQGLNAESRSALRVKFRAHIHAHDDGAQRTIPFICCGKNLTHRYTVTSARYNYSARLTSQSRKRMLGHAEISRARPS